MVSVRLPSDALLQHLPSYLKEKLKEKLPRSVGAQYATGDQWRNNSRKNEGMESKQNRYKGLDLIDRVPDELWNEIRDIVQETGIKTIPMKKKCKKAKWLSGEALQIALKRR